VHRFFRPDAPLSRFVWPAQRRGAPRERVVVLVEIVEDSAFVESPCRCVHGGTQVVGRQAVSVEHGCSARSWDTLIPPTVFRRGRHRRAPSWCRNTSRERLRARIRSTTM